MFGFRRKERELQEITAKATEVIELQRQTIQELKSANDRLSRELDQAHADRMHFAEKLHTALQDIVEIKTGVVSGSKRAVEILEELERQGDKSHKELLGAFKEILMAASKHDATPE